MNTQFLERSYSTDILTFNLGTIENPIADIYISVDQAQKNAKMFKQSLNEEIKLLIVHGILHILDYRDYTKKEKQVMEEEQTRLLQLASQDHYG